MLILRDMIENDIEDYVRWFTADTEWGNWDAPWEPFEDDEETVCENFRNQYDTLNNYSGTKYRFEIELDGEHIGWVGSYRDLVYMENTD
ncbi:MAG: GNAT family N-acetyltransferase, partial [Oscillospiraceae bacterium]|nr:GNAT family N-acetyltransferase [Oscillospiraceae bacterium]